MMSVSMQVATDKLPKRPVLLPGFEHIKCYWDHKNKIYTARIMPGELYVSTGNVVIATVLGSCVSACIRDPVAGIGGMNHFMLPEEENDFTGDASMSKSTRYGKYAMEKMIDTILSYGGKRERLEIKLFGGGKVLQSMTDIGSKNIQFIYEYLAMNKLSIASEDVGGSYPRRVLYFPDTGRALMCRLPLSLDENVCQREMRYQSTSDGCTDSIRKKSNKE